MTDNNHPITPPPELRKQWISEGRFCSSTDYAIIKASRWGYEQCGAVNEAKLQKARDEELEACCEHLKRSMSPRATIDYLRAARRPESTSLKEQALAALSEADQGLNESEWQQRSNTIRRALEALDD